MRKFVIPTAVVLVLVAGSVAWAHVGRQGAEHRGIRGTSGGGVLAEVLGDLVEDGTITPEQSDAVLAALEQRRAEALEAMSEWRTKLASFWEDGVLTMEEIEQLPIADRLTDPDGPLAQALEDGSITRQEFSDLAKSRHGHRGWHGGWTEPISGDTGDPSL